MKLKLEAKKVQRLHAEQLLNSTQFRTDHLFFFKFGLQIFSEKSERMKCVVWVEKMISRNRRENSADDDDDDAVLMLENNQGPHSQT